MIIRKTNIVLLFSLVYMLVSLCVLLFVLYTIATAGHTLQERLHTIADNNAKEKVYKDISSLIATTETQRNELLSFVLTEEQTSAFLTDIESLGKAQGIELTTNSLAVVPQAGVFDQLLITFEFEGTEIAVQNMVKIFETLPYHSHVQALTLKRETNTKTRSTLELGVSLLKI